MQRRDFLRTTTAAGGIAAVAGLPPQATAADPPTATASPLTPRLLTDHSGTDARPATTWTIFPRSLLILEKA
jgi:hypothetical protein